MQHGCKSSENVVWVEKLSNNNLKFSSKKHIVQNPLFLQLLKSVFQKVMYKNFKHATPIQIRFCDLDAMNHVNNANYLTYLEIARIAYFGQSTEIDWDEDRYGLILGRAEINYKLPVFLNDKIEVYTRCSHIGNKSLTLEYEMVKVLSDGSQQTACTATTVMVAYDYKEHHSIPLLEQWKNTILSFENNPELLKA